MKIFIDLDETLIHARNFEHAITVDLLDKRIGRNLTGVEKIKAKKEALNELRQRITSEIDAQLTEEFRGQPSYSYDRRNRESELRRAKICALYEPKGWKLLKFAHSEYYLVRKRPHVSEVINAWRENNQLYLLTSATEQYAMQMVETFRMKSYFKNIYARYDLQDGRCMNLKSDFLLIDNLPVNSMGIKQKLTFIAGRHATSDRHVAIESYYGSDDDTGLLDIKDEVLRLSNEENIVSDKEEKTDTVLEETSV